MNKEEIFYYHCDEDGKDGSELWSFREDTEEQLVIVLVDEIHKTYTIPNKEFVDAELLKECIGILKDKGYKGE